MQAFLELMRLDPQKSHFLTEAMDGHFRQLAAEAKRGDWLRLPSCTWEDIPPLATCSSTIAIDCGSTTPASIQPSASCRRDGC